MKGKAKHGKKSHEKAKMQGRKSQVNARQGKVKQGKSSQDKTRHYKGRQIDAREGKARQLRKGSMLPVIVFQIQKKESISLVMIKTTAVLVIPDSGLVQLQDGIQMGPTEGKM